MQALAPPAPLAAHAIRRRRNGWRPRNIGGWSLGWREYCTLAGTEVRAARREILAAAAKNDLPGSGKGTCLGYRNLLALRSSARQNTSNRFGDPSIPQVTIKTGLKTPDGREGLLTEHFCDHPGCPNIATHALGCARDLSLPAAVVASTWANHGTNNRRKAPT